MSKEPLFEWRDEAGRARRVRIVTNYNDQYETFDFRHPNAVADVMDLASGQIIERVPLAALVPITHP
jgi:hypothetical protein